MSNDVKLEPEAIWLSPRCDAEARHGEGRSWANPAPEAACDDCGLPWVKYVRADLASHQPQREAVLEAINDWVYHSPPVGRQKVIIGCNFDDLADRIHVALTTPAPAVSRDEIDELLYSVIRMPLSNKGGELVCWRKTMSGRLSAILSRLRGEG